MLAKGKTTLMSKEKQKKYHNDKIYLNSKKVFTIASTNSILNSQKQAAFKRMFMILDSDEDKQISINSINLKIVPEYIKKILSPIILMMAKNLICFKEESFIKECNNIFKVNVL